jgi:invasion protein IalB
MMKIHNKNSTVLWRIAPLAAAVAIAFATVPAALAQQQEAQAPETYVAGTHGAWTVRCAGADPNAAGAETSESQSDDGKGDLADEEAATEQTSETPAATRPNCVMVQIAKHSEQADLGISIIVVRQKINEEVVSQMRITTPISVFLPAGVGLEIDGTAIGRLPYEVCSPAGVCVATVFVDEDLEGKLKRGGAAQFFLKDVRGTDGLFALSLNGFTAAFEQLKPGT